jgi:hypothetical protein
VPEPGAAGNDHLLRYVQAADADVMALPLVLLSGSSRAKTAPAEVHAMD